MSFTQDELQSLHTIVEQKLSMHRQETERAFDLRINVLKRELESSFVSLLQEQIHNLSQQILEHQNKLKDGLSQRMDVQQTSVTQALTQGLEQLQQQITSVIERALAAQLLGVEQMVKHHPVSQANGLAAPLALSPAYASEAQASFDAIEVQTEISWDDLVDAVGKALDGRLTAFDESFHAAVKGLEHHLSLQIHGVRDILSSEQARGLNGAATNAEEVFASLEQLERLVESVQVALTANYALLSNRLYHHQHLPVERAHTRNNESATQVTQAHDVKNQLASPEVSEGEQ